MYFEELTLNQVIDIPPVTITKENMLDFASKYDNIPLHTDEEYAKSTHFGGLIAPGVMSFVSVWAKYLEVDPIGRELLAGKSTHIEWYKPVYADDILRGVATITDLVSRNEKNGVAQISIEVHNQRGELVLTNITEAVVKKNIKK